MVKYLLLTVALALGLSGAAARAQSPEEELAGASGLFDAHKYADAARKLDAFLAAHPKHEKAGVAAFVLGRCRTELKQYALAIPAYEKAIASGDASVSNQAELGLGEAAISTHQYDKAAAALAVATRGAMRPDQAAVAWLWLGQSDYQVKKYDEAEAAYMRVIRDFGRSDSADQAYLGAAMADLKLDKTDAARLQLRNLVVRFDRSPVKPQAMLMIGQIDLEAKRYAEARGEFQGVLDLPQAGTQPELASAAQDGLIQTLLELKDYDAAAKYLQQALDRLPATDPQHFRAALSLGNCRYRQQQFEAAHTAYKLAAAAPEPAVAADGAYWAANAELEAKHPAEAADEFEHFVTRFPTNERAARAAYMAAESYTTANMTAPAMHCYRLVAAKYPTSPEAADARKALGDLVGAVNDPAQLAVALKSLPPSERAAGTLRLARLYLDANKPTEAAAALTELMKTKPEPDVTAEGSYLLGVAYDVEGRHPAAATALTDAVRLAPSAPWIPDAATRLAWIDIELKQPASGEKAAQTAISALATHPDAAAESQARLALAQSQVDQKKWDAALETCKAVLAGSPTPANAATAVYTEAWIAEKLNRPDDARPLWQRLVSEFPRSPYAAGALLSLGDAAMTQMKYDDAAASYGKVVSDYSDSSRIAEAHFKLGSALYNADKAPDAVKQFDIVAADRSAGPFTSEALYWAGVAYAKTGQKPEAIQRLEKLVATYPQSARVANAKIRLAALKAGVSQ